MKIEFLKINDVVPADYNPRKLSDKQRDDIKSSLLKFGFVDPVIINRNPDRMNVVVGGHQRLKVWESMGNDTFPAVFVDLPLEKEKELNVRLNKNTGEWDFDILLSEFDACDLDDWGFEDSDFPDIDVLPPEETVGGDDVGDPPEIPKTVIGDLYELGGHRLLCGDSTSIDAVNRLMGGAKADLLHTDPPYNVDYDNGSRPKPGKSLGKIQNDTMDGASFYEFLKSAFTAAYVVLKDGSSAYVWHADRETINFKQAVLDSGFDFAQTIIWKKPMLLSRTRYQWAHEPCLFFVKGVPYFTDDRKKTTVWDFGGYDKSKNVHPTQKPVFIPEEAINNSSKQGSNVLDLFGGSGSTLIACEKTSRKCFMMELDPKYCDVIVRRYVKFCKENGRKYSVMRNGEPCDDFEV